LYDCECVIASAVVRAGFVGVEDVGDWEMDVSETRRLMGLEVRARLVSMASTRVGIHTSAVVGARVLVGAVLLALASPGLRGSGRGEDGGGSSQQGSSSVGQHVVMLHNRT
jgi:hypothetical protein